MTNVMVTEWLGHTKNQTPRYTFYGRNILSVKCCFPCDVIEVFHSSLFKLDLGI